MLDLGQRSEVEPFIRRVHPELARETVLVPPSLEPQPPREALETVVERERQPLVQVRKPH